MRYLSIAYIFSVALLVLTGCSSKIDGEVFVVTKGGESKKLGLVDVNAYKIADLDDFKKSLIADYSEYMNSLQNDFQFDGLKELYEARKLLIADKEKANKIYEKCHTSWLGKECEAKLPKELSDKFEKESVRIKDETAKLFAGVPKLDYKFDLLFMASKVANLTKDIAPISVRSDADGRFQMNIPRGDHLIVGIGARQALGEDYLWLMRNPKSGKLRLANDSMFDQGCEICLLSQNDLKEIKKAKEKIGRFIGNSNGAMMIYTGKEGDTHIDGIFWDFLSGTLPFFQVKVFDWVD